MGKKIKVRFNLGRGENYMKWKVEYPNGWSKYFAPTENQLILKGCQLKNSRTTAMKILNGQHKVVCAWVLCDEIEIIQDNLKCEDAAPDNGEIRAVVFESGVEAADYSKYGFQWYAGSDPTAPVVPNPKGQLDRLTAMAEGDYTVIVTNLDKGCESLPIDTTIVRIGVDPVITIVENSPQSQCSPFNGELEVFIDGGNAGFTFEWFKGAGLRRWVLPLL